MGLQTQEGEPVSVLGWLVCPVVRIVTLVLILVDVDLIVLWSLGSTPGKHSPLPVTFYDNAQNLLVRLERQY